MTASRLMFVAARVACALLFVALVPMSACSSEVPRSSSEPRAVEGCQLGAVRECNCKDAREGTQTCVDDWEYAPPTWGPCACTGDASTGSGGGDSGTPDAASEDAGACQPSCSELGLECGIHPLCGISCGTCASGDCVKGQCDCGALTTCDGLCKDLDSDPENCGGCGVVCPVGASCSAGQCLCPGQQQDCGGTCMDVSADPQNCGGCGIACSSGQTCTFGACCTPLCGTKQCGSDGCGGSCGTCASGTCTNAGQCCSGTACGAQCCGSGQKCYGGQCCTPSCSGKQCGSDGCGGSCGSCPAGLSCSNGTCVCKPSCAGKECGSDGCGGSCGSCPSSIYACQSGQCVQTMCWNWGYGPCYKDSDCCPGQGKCCFGFNAYKCQCAGA